MEGLIQRDHYVGNPLDRIAELEKQVAKLERALATVIRAKGSGTGGATEQAWAEVVDADGAIGYVRIYAAK